MNLESYKMFEDLQIGSIIKYRDSKDTKTLYGIVKYLSDKHCVVRNTKRKGNYVSKKMFINIIN